MEPYLCQSIFQFSSQLIYQTSPNFAGVDVEHERKVNRIRKVSHIAFQDVTWCEEERGKKMKLDNSRLD